MLSKLLLISSLSYLFVGLTVLEAQTLASNSIVAISTGDSVRVLNDSTQFVLKRVRSTKRGAVIGAVAGGSLGLVAGTVVASNMSTVFGGRPNFAKAVGAGILTGAAGAVSWGLIGAGVGSLISRQEWKRVAVRGMSVSVSF